MANQCCPTCGRAFKAPKAAPIVDLEAMTTEQRIAHYRKTSPVEDTAFALRVGVKLSPELAGDWQALLSLAPTLTRAEAQRRLSLLQARWRSERFAAELEKRQTLAIVALARTTYIPIRVNPARLIAFGPHTRVRVA